MRLRVFSEVLSFDFVFRYLYFLTLNLKNKNGSHRYDTSESCPF